ncbi:hypothetical protein L7F22_036022 [Adiantum nelumboides]|nr:hypothetical protein [Adiantum nelumboides]
MNSGNLRRRIRHEDVGGYKYERLDSGDSGDLNEPLLSRSDPDYRSKFSTFDKAKKHKKRAEVPSSSSFDSSSDSSEEERKGKKRSKKQRHGKGKKKTRKSKSHRVVDSSTEDTSTDSSDFEDGHFYANKKNFYKANHLTFWKTRARKSFSSSFHPQTDGQSEIANSVVWDLLKFYILDQKTQWERYLPLVEFAHNNTIHSSTGKAPFEILEGAMKVPPFLSTKDKIFEADEYTRDLDTAFAKARLRKKKEKERLFPKLSMRYYGPFQITERINDVSFRLRLHDTWKIHNAFHVSLLKPFRGEVPDEQPEVEENEEILVPEQILAHKDTKTKEEANSIVLDLLKCYVSEHRFYGPFQNLVPEEQLEVEELDEILVREHIVAHKERKVRGKVARRYLVKFKKYSRMDAKWMEEAELFEDNDGDWEEKKHEVQLVWSQIFVRLLAQWAQFFAALFGRASWPGTLLFWGAPRQSESQEQSDDLELTPLQEERLRTLQGRIEIPFDGTYLWHQDALRELWAASFPDRQLIDLVSEQWKDMGWQGKDPSTDFRGGGFISLENLLFFAKEYPRSFHKLLHKDEGCRATWEYPFAVAGINISFMLLQFLDLRSAKPKTSSGRQFVKLLEEDEFAFDRLYCVAFEMMDAQWLAMKASYMEFNAVLKATQAQLEREMSLDDVTCIQDLPAFNLLRHN